MRHQGCFSITFQVIKSYWKATVREVNGGMLFCEMIHAQTKQQPLFKTCRCLPILRQSLISSSTMIEATRKIHPMLRSVRSLSGPGMVTCDTEDQLLPDLVKPTPNSHESIRSALALVILVLIEVEAQACFLPCGKLVIFSIGLRVLYHKPGQDFSYAGRVCKPFA